MSLESYLAFVVVELLLCLSPGPAVMLVVGQTMRQGLSAGAAATCGILMTNGLYFLLAAAGVGAVILASPAMFTAIKWIGVAYLFWTGLQIVRSAVATLRNDKQDSEVQNMDRLFNVSVGKRKVSGVAFRQGLVLQAANPKNIAFFVAVLPQFVATGTGLAGNIALLGVTSVVIEAIVLFVYASFFDHISKRLSVTAIAWIEIVSGAVLAIFAVGLMAYSME
jgi:homoserine/homoserine lactone efflux protein